MKYSEKTYLEVLWLYMQIFPLALPTATTGSVFDHAITVRVSLKPVSIVYRFAVFESHSKIMKDPSLIIPSKSPSLSHPKPVHCLKIKTILQCIHK